MENHEQHASHSKSRLWPWALGTTGAVIAAPYALPLLGIGSYNATEQLLSICGSGTGKGLAGGVSHLLHGIPGIGGTITSSMGSILSSGIIGLGGSLLGRYIEKHYDKPGEFPWGKAIRYASLATSILIALPSILSSITIGLAFLGFLMGGAALASSMMGSLIPTVGIAQGISATTAGTGITALMPHLFTCGAASLPIIGSLFSGKDQPAEKAALASSPSSWAERVQTPTNPSHAMGTQL